MGLGPPNRCGIIWSKLKSTRSYYRLYTTETLTPSTTLTKKEVNSSLKDQNPRAKGRSGPLNPISLRRKATTSHFDDDSTTTSIYTKV